MAGCATRTRSAGHSTGSAQANHALTFKLDQSLAPAVAEGGQNASKAIAKVYILGGKGLISKA